ncbi:hypothetical protein ABZ690_21035 [Streptomyces sp. NPDC006967]|uniref:hypothetical protein n=1 Tax=unclassified Streptomyces TaxID=2593676 RepID=UPI0033EEAF61
MTPTGYTPAGAYIDEAPEPEQPPTLPEAATQLGAALRQFAAAYVAAAAPVVRAVAQVTERVHAAEQARRPAWQSPYGPPTRRH